MCSVRGLVLDSEQFGLPGFDSEPWAMCVQYLGLFLCNMCADFGVDLSHR